MLQILKRTPLLQRAGYLIDHEGELVTITIGSTTLKMHYEDAIVFSQHIRSHGKAAKRAAGDMSRHWSAIAVLGGAPEK